MFKFFSSFLNLHIFFRIFEIGEGLVAGHGQCPKIEQFGKAGESIGQKKPDPQSGFKGKKGGAHGRGSSRQ